MSDLVDRLESVIHWWQLPDNAPAGVARLVCRRAAMATVAASSRETAVQVAVAAALRRYQCVTPDAGAPVAPNGAMERQRLLDHAVLDGDAELV